MARKFSGFTDGLTNQSPTDTLVGLDVSLSAAAQNSYWTLNNLFSVITRNITDGALRFQGFAAPSLSAAGAGSLYFDSSSNTFKLSQNGGAYADIHTGTITVPQGGTGLASLTTYALMAAGTTATGNMQQVSGVGTSGQVLTSNGAGALPTWQSVAAGGIGGSIAVNQVAVGSGVNTIAGSSALTFTSGTLGTTGAIIQTSNLAAAFASGPNGATNPVFQLVNSTASAATGVSITGAAAGAGVVVAAISSNGTEKLTLSPKGAAAVELGATTLVRVFGAGSPELRLEDTSTTNPWMTFYSGGSRQGLIQYSGSVSRLEVRAEGTNDLLLRTVGGRFIGAAAASFTPITRFHINESSSSMFMITRDSIDPNSWWHTISYGPDGVTVLNPGSYTIAPRGPGAKAADFAITTRFPGNPNFVIKSGAGNVGINTLGPDRQLEINSATGDNLRLTYNDDSGSAANFCDFQTTSGGNLTVTASGGLVNVAGNLTLGLTAVGTSGTRVMALSTGTPPTTSPADAFQIYSTDINGTGGQAGAHLRNEISTAALILPGVRYKTDTGDPSDTYEGMMAINTFDNTFKVYADSAWRTIATW